MRHIIQRSILILALVFSSLFVASPARAAWGDCGNYPGTICLFASTGWVTPIWRQYPSQINGCRALTGFNDVTTQAVNNTPAGYTLTVWQHANCTGWNFSIGSNKNINFYGTSWDNGASGVSIIAS